MSALADVLKARIARDGPISIAAYMQECLLNPRHGYYATRDPFGTAGDFVTAPEISQMFGEIIGLFLAQVWMDQERPAPFVLAELGPGRGTLMTDALRAMRAVPGLVEAAEIHLIEASPVLRDTQTRTIPETLTHHDTLATLPDGPLFLVANEFFDALPIRQFQRSGASWRERVVGLSGEELTFGLSDQLSPPILAERLDDPEDGQLVEHCAPATALVS